jgi:hypothetical protein
MTVNPGNSNSKSVTNNGQSDNQDPKQQHGLTNIKKHGLSLPHHNEKTTQVRHQKHLHIA